LVSQLSGSLLGKAVVIIIVALIVRVTVTFLVSFEKKYNYKERLFFSFAWIGKATV
jgi:hypothetical protein